MNPGLAYSYLVPCDFTDKSIHALTYVAGIIKNYDGMVHLLHVVDDRLEPEEDVMEATKEKVTAFTRKQQDKLGINIVPNVVTGNIFHSIGDMASQLGAQLIVMGTHGMHGIQFIIGSFAARVILGSPVPVLLTKGTKQFEGFKDIVLPLDMSLNSRHLIRKTIDVGLLFNSTIHLYFKNEKFDFWQTQKAENTIKSTLRLIRKAGLNCQNVSLEAKDERFTDSVLKYAANINADLIMVTTQYQENSKEQVILNSSVRLMEQSETPLFFLNPIKEK